MDIHNNFSDFESLLSAAMQDACDQGEGLDELLALRVRGKSDKTLVRLVDAALEEIRPPLYWKRRPGHEKRLATAQAAWLAAGDYLACYDEESTRKPANSRLPAMRLCLELAIEDYWRAEVIERWGPFAGFRTYAYVDAYGKARVVFFPGEAEDAAFTVDGSLGREAVETRIERWRLGLDRKPLL